MPNPVTTLSARQKKALLAIDQRNLEMVSNAFMASYGDLQGDIDALMLAIEKLDNPTAAEIKRLPQYKRLIRNAENELDDFTQYVNRTIGAVAITAIGAGLADSVALMRAYGVKAESLSPAAMRPLLDYLKKDGKLYKRLALLTKSTVDRVVDTIIGGVAQGFNPRKIAALIQDAFGGGLTDALRNVRTVQLYSYRDSARANYMASGAVAGWVWYAQLDADVCMSCVALHGTIHPLDEKLDDHYNGRCAALPYIPEFGNPVEQTGQEWFETLPPEQQKSMMGNSKHEAWAAGKFEFEKLSRQTKNEVYATMRTETPLKDLISE